MCSHGVKWKAGERMLFRWVRVCRRPLPWRVATVALLAGAAFTPSSFASAVPPQAGSAERALFEAANRERSAQGLSALRWDAALAGAARQHAERMATQNTLSHQ